MNRSVRVILGVFAFTGAVAAEDAVNSQVPLTGGPAVIAQELKKMRVPGRIATVMWTRRPEYYTLQLAYPSAGRVMLVAKQDPSVATQGTDVQMWLLKADGTAIFPLWRSTDPAQPKPSTSKKPTPEAPMRDVVFRFPLSAGKEAVAAAVRIGDLFVVDQIAPYKD